MIALLLLVPAAPIALGVGLLIRQHDAGPALINLRRVGCGGSTLWMWKLRTMYQASGATRAAGGPLTVSDDPRITRPGRWIRKCRLDELPQLLNVAVGSMGLIGPRPETPEYVDQTDPQWQAVLLAKPGIAGPTQVLLHEQEAALLTTENANAFYRHNLLPLKLEIDRWYVENASVAVDALIIISLVEQFVLHSHRTALERFLTLRNKPLILRVGDVRAEAAAS